MEWASRPLASGVYDEAGETPVPLLQALGRHGSVEMHLRKSAFHLVEHALLCPSFFSGGPSTPPSLSRSMEKSSTSPQGVTMSLSFPTKHLFGFAFSLRERLFYPKGDGLN